MKNPFIINRSIKLILIGLIFNLLQPFEVLAQEEETIEYDYSFRFKTIKNADQSRSLVVNFYGEADREKYPVYQAEIQFINTLEDEQVILGTATTNDAGVAELKLEPGRAYLKDAEGYITFLATFEGRGEIASMEEEIAVIDLNLTMELEESEDGNSITVYANVLNAAGEEEPLEESDIYFYVQGMINKLKIEDGWLEYGEYSFEFPANLPGDKDKNLTIYAQINDSDDYGNVVASKTANWGVGPIITKDKTPKLWTELGPEWMILALSALLIGVWANLIHAIYNLVKIKKEGQNLSES